MIKIRKARDRGHYKIDWLDSYHSFSFGDYYDPDQMGFRTLRVINQDRVRPGTGFPLHPHRDMEILSFVLEGALRHKDDMGNEETIYAGEVQKMSAGSGIMHSEFNPSDTEEVHFLQIWILPDEKGLEPSYLKKKFAPKAPDTLQLLASRDGKGGSVLLHQDLSLYSGDISPDSMIDFTLPAGRHAWIQILSGELELLGTKLEAGDGAAVSEEKNLTFTSTGGATFLLFEMA